ncbi:MAG: ribokinase [Chloroflexi bacterium 44-23]|nr:MAG: ribokinase [Chloroflexi bacterium 44-23]
MDIVVVGSNMIDFLCHIPRIPKMGETLIGDSFHLGFGGKGANQAVMAAKLGARVGMVTKVGDDLFGKMIRDNLSNFGISTENVYLEKGGASGVAPIFVDSDGSNIIVIIPGANLMLSAEEVKQAAEQIRSAKLVVSQLEIRDDAIMAGFKIARDAGILTILNPAPARLINSKLIALSDILIPNETEAEMLTGIEVSGIKGAEEAAQTLQKLGAQKILITLGKDGVFLFDNGDSHHFPAVKVDITDTTGAGDSFIGSLAYALSTGQGLPDAVRFANLAAALSVTKIGTQTSFPTLAEVEAFLKT